MCVVRVREITTKILGKDNSFHHFAVVGYQRPQRQYYVFCTVSSRRGYRITRVASGFCGLVAGKKKHRQLEAARANLNSLPRGLMTSRPPTPYFIRPARRGGMMTRVEICGHRTVESEQVTINTRRVLDCDTRLSAVGHYCERSGDRPLRHSTTRRAHEISHDRSVWLLSYFNKSCWSGMLDLSIIVFTILDYEPRF
ncbi:hypothetical protein J6590_048430 [Homalodisca vitripennis]|nr:hypothetical protein J6590_048430 [Homalodisca vitripennis]